MFSFFFHSFQDHMPGIALRPWEGPSNLKQQLRQCQIDLPTVQSGGCISPIKVPSLQMTLVRHKLSKTNSSAQPLSFLGCQSNKKKINKDTIWLIDLTEAYRLFHHKETKYMFFFIAYGAYRPYYRP